MKPVEGAPPGEPAPERPCVPDPDQRRFSRVPFEAEVRLFNPHLALETPLIDLSLKGAMLARPAAFAGKVGERFSLDVPLGSGSGRVVVHMEVSLVHVEAATMGFRCESIDLESITHLRRLMELNLGDGELLERELLELARGRPAAERASR
jgi:hypothetical protein